MVGQAEDNLHTLKKIIYLFLAVLGLHCCARAFSSSGEQELLAVLASLVAEHRL